MKPLVALVSGALFGIGLVVSDMIDPARVLGFLDVAGGQWDPTLGFVMAGAMAPMIVAWRFARAPRRPQFGNDFPAPAGAVDRQLIVGAVLFGIGWGLVGLCPGPALANLLVSGKPVWFFVAAMIAGFAVAGLAARRRS